MSRSTFPTSIVHAIVDASATAVGSARRGGARSHQEQIIVVAAVALAALAYAFDNPHKREWREFAVKLGVSALLDLVIQRILPFGAAASASASNGIFKGLAIAPYAAASGLAARGSKIAIDAIKGPILEQLAKELSPASAPRKNRRR